MKKLTRSLTFYALLAGSIFTWSCTEDEEPAIAVNFENTEAGISSSSISADISLIFSRPTREAGSISLQVNGNNLKYGEAADFYTQPAASEGSLLVTFEAGIESVSFSVFGGKALNITQDETITFTLGGSADDYVAGTNNVLTLTFGENFVAQSGMVTLDAGGEEFPNKVFLDLSKRTQTSVDKHSWDLAFSTESGHYVSLNSSAGVMARALDETDITAVTAEDTVGFAAEMVTNGYAPPGSPEWVDDPTGELSATAFGGIAASGNSVFIVKTASGTWKKVVVYQSGEDYELQFGNIADTEVETVTITRQADYNFMFYSFNNGQVTVEPAKTSWDIAYGTYTNVINFGYELPYVFNDFITINRAGTSVAMVMIEGDVTYEDFTLADSQSLTFSPEINAIGSSWRQGGGSGTAPAVFEDRFFVLKDSGGNTYKIRFDKLTNGSGERGFTDLTFERLSE